VLSKESEAINHQSTSVERTQQGSLENWVALVVLKTKTANHEKNQRLKAKG
jgi:hypothetical protein